MSPPPDATAITEDLDNRGSVPEVQSENSDAINDTNAGLPRRTAWNRPSNGVVEACSVMGGSVSWPALSESTRPVPRSSPDVSRSMADGSTASSQVAAVSPLSQRQASNSNQPNSGPNHHRQRPRNRNGAAGGGNNVGNTSSGNGPPRNNVSRPVAPVPPPFSTFVVPYQLVQPALETSVSGVRPVRGFGVSQSHSGNEHSSNRNTSRRANYGPRPHGESQYHNNHGGRRDQDRRDPHVIPPYIVSPLRYMSPPIPPAAGPFIPPPPPPPMTFFPPMGFDVSSIVYPPTMSPEPLGPVPMMPPPFPFYIPPTIENPLTGMITKQIDYYFSDDNLIKDNFLRGNMDDNGWVPISLVASFPRVQNLTKDIPTILEALKYSSVVEVQGEKLRRYNDWNRWLFSDQPSNNGQRSSSGDALAASIQDISLNSTGEEQIPKEETNATMHNLSDSSPRQSELVNGDNTSAAV